MNEYENYYNLAKTILISEYEEKESCVAIYDMNQEEMCVGIFNNVSTIATIFKTTKECIYSCISKKSHRNGRFLIERIKL